MAKMSCGCDVEEFKRRMEAPSVERKPEDALCDAHKEVRILSWLDGMKTSFNNKAFPVCACSDSNIDDAADSGDFSRYKPCGFHKEWFDWIREREGW